MRNKAAEGENTEVGRNTRRSSATASCSAAALGLENEVSATRAAGVYGQRMGSVTMKVVVSKKKDEKAKWKKFSRTKNEKIVTKSIQKP